MELKLFKKEYLDYHDVLIIPTRTSLESRKEVNVVNCWTIERTALTPDVLAGVPVIVSNMDSSGTFEVAKVAIKEQIFTALHKHYTVKELIDFFRKNVNALDYCFITVGLNETYKIQKVYEAINFKRLLICLDVANGHMFRVLEEIRKLRSFFPNSIIMAGNITESSVVKDYARAGANICKVGIGCFVAGTKITTVCGPKNIEDININDIVLTHDQKWQKVTNTFTYNHHKTAVCINNEITTTPNHKFYVIHKRVKNIVTDKNIHEYAEWVSAEKLTKNHLLIKNLSK